jgi:hypothetical protein
LPIHPPLGNFQSQTACNRKHSYHDSCTLCRGSALYPRVVISSLAKRLWIPHFCHDYTSSGVWPRDDYMLLQRSTIGLCHALLRFLKQTVLACSTKVSCTNVPSCTMWFRRFTKYVTKYDHKVWFHPHSIEHGTQPIVFLISKQVIPYWTHGGTCCPGALKAKTELPHPRDASCAGSQAREAVVWRGGGGSFARERRWGILHRVSPGAAIYRR